MSVILAAGAAFSNALYVMTQHLASTSGRRSRATGLHLVVSLLRSPLWLSGWIAAVGAFVFQAAALNHGQLSIVQAVLVTELVFGLVLRKAWIHQEIRAAAWIYAVITCAGLAAFVLIDEPQGGVATPPRHDWLVVLVVSGVATAAMTLAARRGTPTRRAALYAAAAAIVWALVATFIKAATESLTNSGIAAVFGDWPVYALLVGGILGIILSQAALHVGPLSVSQPILVILDPTVSVILSIVLFQEHYTGGPAAVLGAVVGFLVMCTGVVGLTRSAPPTMLSGARRPGPAPG